MGTRRTTNTAVMPGLDPPARPKPLRRGEGPASHVGVGGTAWVPGTSPGMTSNLIVRSIAAGARDHDLGSPANHGR